MNIILLLLSPLPQALLLNLSRPFADDPTNIGHLISLRGEVGAYGGLNPVKEWRDSYEGLAMGECKTRSSYATGNKYSVVHQHSHRFNS